VRDDRPFAGSAPPAALFFYSRDRKAEHPLRHLAAYRGILQADAYSGFNDLYAPACHPGPVIEASCWAHARPKFFELAELDRAPLALDAVRRIDAIFAIERDINCLPVGQRLAERRARVVPILTDLETWMRTIRTKLSRHADVAKAMDYMLIRWNSFSRFTNDGRICLSNNAAERMLRGVAIGRKALLFAGSDRGGERAATIYSLIVTARLNDVDPRAWLADVIARIADHPASWLYQLLRWNWKKPSLEDAACLYNAFGDKRSLYGRALDHYVEASIADRIRRCEALPPCRAIEVFFDEIVKRSLGDRDRKGCLLVNAALDVAPHDPEFRKIVAAVLVQIEVFFLACVRAAQADGTITRSLSAETLAQHLLGVLMGIRVLARVRLERALLKGILVPALALLRVEPRASVTCAD